MKYLLCFLSFILTLSTSCRPDYQQCRSQFLGNLPTQSLHAHVMIPVSIVHDDTGMIIGSGTGAGTIIAQAHGRAYVLTAKHVATADGLDLPEGTHLELSVITERIIRDYPMTLDSRINAIKGVRVEKLHPLADLALLSYPTKFDSRIPRIFLAKNDPEIGVPVWLIGSPGGHFRSLLARVVSAKVGRDVSRATSNKAIGCAEGVECYLVDGPAEPGFSGGPAFDSNGCLVGVIYAVRVNHLNDQFMNGVVISTSTIRDFLKGIIQEHDIEGLIQRHKTARARIFGSIRFPAGT